MAKQELIIGKVRGEDGKGIIPGGVVGQTMIKRTNQDYDIVWTNVVRSINATSPDETGNINLPVIQNNEIDQLFE